jgi:hypothetical protein
MGWAKSSISSWLKLSPRLQQVAKLPWLVGFKRLRSVVLNAESKCRTEQDELYQRFLFQRQSKGQEVDQRWLKDEMRTIMKTNQPPQWQHFKYSNGWLQKFLEHYGITSQVQTEKKQMCNSLRVPLLQTFHRELCELQRGKGLNERDPVFGRFPPQSIWNIDQIPFYFIKSHRRSYNPKGHACWILNQGPSGIDKRMATIIMTLRAEGDQIIPPFLLFKGQGQLAAELLAELDAQGVPYAFNEKAWANESACLDHLLFFHRRLQEHCPELKEHLLLLDGLASQATDRFIELALDLQILPMYFPPNCTHLVQPVDHRVAAWLKGQMHDLFKAEEELMHEMWANYRDNGSMCPQYQRVTTLKWVRTCWSVLKQRKKFLLRAFLSTGCLITLEGLHAIHFPDIENYFFEYPFPTSLS